MSRALRSLLAGGLLYAPRAAAAADPSAPDLMERLRDALRNYASVNDYTALFTKQQRVGGTLCGEERMLLKFRKPFMVYMKWIGDIDTGREVLYVGGMHDGKVLVHLGGMINYLAPSFALSPTGTLAMRKNLRPITESGIENTTRLLLEVCEKAREKGDLAVRYCGGGNISGRPTDRFQRTLPAEKGYPAHRTLIELDRETGFPLSVVSYGWKGELLEKYLYDELKANVGLSDKDFDRGNRSYGFGYVTVPVP